MDINLIAPLNTLSFGLTSLNLLKAFCQAGHRVSWWPIGATEVPPADLPLVEKCRRSSVYYDELAPSLRVFHPFDSALHAGKGLHSLLAIFELDRFTDEELHQLHRQDVIFAPSYWAGQVLIDNGIPVEKVVRTPLGVEPSLLEESFSANDSPTTTLLHVGKWEVRKNQEAIVRAFCRAFTKDDDVQLILHCTNPFLSKEEDARWHAMAQPHHEMRSKIRVTSGRPSNQQEVFALMRKADWGVFPSRAEGFNLSLIEMLALGKPCIATYCSAHTEFCSPANCLLVEANEFEEARDGKWFFGQGRWAKWGPKQDEQLVEQLRAAHTLKQSGDHLFTPQKVRDSVKSLTWDNTGKLITEGFHARSSRTG